MKARNLNITPLRRTEELALIDRYVCNDFTAFTRRTFETVATGEKLKLNWHIPALAHALEGVRGGKTKRLMILMPPRHLKSLTVSVAFPAFLLGHEPNRKIIAVSYADGLSTKLHNDCRAVMNASWYRRAFPATKISREKNTENEFMTTRRGGRFATSVGGTLIGRGGSLMIIDDPMKPEAAASEVERRRVNDWFNMTAISRLNNKIEDAIILVMQRLHIDDLAGVLLQKGGWEVLELQAIAEKEQDIPIGPGQIFHRDVGNVLHPDYEPMSVLLSTKASMGSMQFSAQYQQRPIPLEGNLIKRKWLKTFDAAPVQKPGDLLVISWDTAQKASELANHSVGTVWLARGDNCYLLDLVRGRYDFPGLKRAALALKTRWPGAANLIEDKGSGTSLIQELRALAIPVIAITPEGDKVTRLFAVGQMFESGGVHFPKIADWLPTLLEELLAFPHYRSDDQVDSISQALAWIQMKRRGRNLNNVDIGMPSSIPNEPNPFSVMG
jgi:predicted phage terminase large subunit-like protein